MKSKYYTELMAHLAKVASNGDCKTVFSYAPNKKSARAKKDGSFSITESGYQILAKDSKGKTTIADYVGSLPAAIELFKPFMGTFNKNRAIIAVYALQSHFGTKEVIKPEAAEAADDTVAVLEKSEQEYKDRMANDQQFHDEQVEKLRKSEMARHEKRVAKIDAM